MSEIFVGVDGGGTHTRAIAITSTGEIVGRANSGGSNPEFDANARLNTQSAIQQFSKSSRRLVATRFNKTDIDVAIAGGVAGSEAILQSIKTELNADSECSFQIV